MSLLRCTYAIAHTPHGDTHALGLVQAALGDGGVVVDVVVLDVQLGDGDLLDAGRGKGLDGAGERAALARVQVALRADAVNGNARGQPLLDVGDHAVGQLGRGRAVQVVVVDVQLGIGVGGARGLEGDANEVLAEHVGEDAAAQRAILVEHLVDNVLEGAN